MPLRHIPLVDNASFTIQNTLRRKSRKQQIQVIYVRKAKIMENTMGHECCKIGPVPMKSMFLWNVIPWCLEAFVLSKFCCTAGFVIQFTENMHFRTTMDLSTNGYLAATQRTNATHSTKVLPNTHTFWGSFFKIDPHCVYVVAFAVSDKHILWLGLRLLSSAGLPVQSDCRNFNFKKYPMLCKQNYRHFLHW